ncbi:MAG: putative Ig domain-containing protein [Synergistaceae bacterium]|nr:putative Ig domain-containing protein [Synergistaceae bacterium]MBQ3450304.1 putative Ig domain-containing protein [Synergistaceae bacterium]
MLRKFLFALAIIISFVSCSFAYSGGRGTKSSPYIIASYDDMDQLRTDTNASESSNIYYKLSNDIQMSRYSWTASIGSSSSTPFAGHFDGNSCTVYVHIRDSSSSSLFGYVSSDAVIENLKVEGQIYSYGDAAGIALQLDGGVIANCRFSGNIYVRDYDISSYITTNLNAGGIVEYMTSGTVADCSFNGEITVNGGIYPRAGGIAALMHGGNITGCTITHYSKIAAYAADITAYDYEYIYDNPSAIAGGIAGQVNINLDETIEDCVFRGEVIAESSHTSYAGGIAGFVRGGILRNNTVLDDSQISSSYSAGGIAGILTSGGSIDSNDVQGGSIVQADSHSAGGITGILDLGNVTDNNSYASVTGNASYKGGIIGEVTPATSDPATGKITGNTYSGYDYAIGKDASGLPSDRGSSKVPESELPFRITTPSNLAAVKINVPYSMTFTTYPASSTSGYVTWSLVSGDISSSGLTFNAGVLSGTPASTGTFTFTLTASLSSSQTHTKTFTLTVEDPLVITTSSYLPDGKAGVQYESITLSTDAEYGSLVTWTAANMPGGLEIGPLTGTISGTPETAGYYTFTVTAQSGQYTAAKEFTIVIYPSLRIITDSRLPHALTGHDYSVTLATDINSFDSQYVIWSCDSLPESLNLDSKTGIISGIPLSEGTFTFSVSASVDTPSGFYTDTKEFMLTVTSAFEITDDSVLPSAIVNHEYSHKLSLSITESQPANVTWKLESGNLPDGLSFDLSTGTIKGTASLTGEYKFTVSASLDNIKAEKTFTLAVVSEFTISTASELPDARPYESYLAVLSVNGGSSSAVTWQLISGKLPEGIEFDSRTGIISGSSSKEGIYEFTISASVNSSSERLSAQKKFILRVCPELQITNESSYTFDAGTSLSLRFFSTITGSLWSVLSGDIPPGLSLNEDTLSGTALKAGTFRFTLQAVNGYSLARKVITFKVNLVISSPSYLPNGMKGESYFEVLRVNGANSAEWSLITSPDTLPSGLSLNINGTIQGVPATEGVYDFIVNASDDNGLGARKLLRITIDSDSAVPITTASLPSGKSGESYYAELHSTVSGVTWTISDGRLPNGLTLNALNGLISGIPYESGTFTFTVRASYGQREGTRRLTLWISPADVQKESEDTHISSSGGGGGCNTGLNLSMIFAFLIFIFRRRF